MKIKRPDWSDFTFEENFLSHEEINAWFDKYVEPLNKMLEEGTDVVLGWGYLDIVMKQAVNQSDEKWHYKGLIVNIEPILGKDEES